MTSKEVLAQGGIEKLGQEDSFLKVTLSNGEKKILNKFIPEHTAGVKFIFETLTDSEIGALKDLHEINAVGHRVVHGGTKFNKSVLITDEVIETIKECSELSPLHNPANLKGIDAVKSLMPEIPQIAVFDTAFHQTMPEHAYLYPIPNEYYEKYGMYSIQHSIRQCLNTLIYIRYLTNITKNMVSAVMVSTEHLTATYQNVYANS